MHELKQNAIVTPVVAVIGVAGVMNEPPPPNPKFTNISGCTIDRDREEEKQTSCATQTMQAQRRNGKSQRKGRRANQCSSEVLVLVGIAVLSSLIILRADDFY